MPTPTYVALAKTVLTGTQASITFSPIPSTYTDLLILVSARSDRSSQAIDPIKIRFNGATADTNLTSRQVYASGTSAGSQSNAYANTGYATGSATTSNTFASIEIYIPNYAGNTNKPISSTSANENNSATTYEIDGIAGLWSSTNAITEIILLPNTGPNFVSGSRFDLYGIKNS